MRTKRKTWLCLPVAAVVAWAAAPAGGGDGPVALKGTVLPFRESFINARIDTGNVAEIYVEEGQEVEEGDELLKLDDAVRQAEYDYRKLLADDETLLSEAKERKKKAEQDLNRIKGLVAEKAESLINEQKAQSDYNLALIGVEIQESTIARYKANLKVLEAQLELYTVRAPFSGVISKKAIELGEATYPLNKQLFHLVDMHKVYVSVHPDISLLKEVFAGQRAKVTVAIYPEKVFAGEVHDITRYAESGGSLFGFKVLLDNGEGLLLPQMKALVTLEAKGAAEEADEAEGEPSGGEDQRVVE